jgi:hypothetical protein
LRLTAAGVVGSMRPWAAQAGVSLLTLSFACQNGEPPKPSEPAASALAMAAAPAPPAERWQRVRHGGTMGWVNARFLSGALSGCCRLEKASPGEPPP